MTKFFRFGECPFIEVGCVFEAEPGQEVVAVDRNRIREKGDAKRYVSLCAALFEHVYEVGNIQPNIRLRI